MHTNQGEISVEDDPTRDAHQEESLFEQHHPENEIAFLTWPILTFGVLTWPDVFSKF